MTYVIVQKLTTWAAQTTIENKNKKIKINGRKQQYNNTKTTNNLRFDGYPVTGKSNNN